MNVHVFIKLDEIYIQMSTNNLIIILLVAYFSIILETKTYAYAMSFYNMHNLFTHIRKTCPCNAYPLKPHFYIVKLGFAGVYLFFLFLLQNIDCGYSLSSPREF